MVSYTLGLVLSHLQNILQLTRSTSLTLGNQYMSLDSQYIYTIYLLLRYQLKANCPVSMWNGVGTSDSPGLATGCLRYTAAHMF